MWSPEDEFLSLWNLYFFWWWGGGVDKSIKICAGLHYKASKLHNNKSPLPLEMVVIQMSLRDRN